MERLIGIVGFMVLLGIAVLLSNNKKKINLRTVFAGIGIQFFLGLLLLKWQTGAVAMEWFAGKVAAFLDIAQDGARFLFGNIINPEFSSTFGFQFAFTVLPVIVFFSAFMAILYYLGIMQRVVQVFAWVMKRLMKTSGAESLSCSANAFVGQTEAPLIIRPFINNMTMSELCTIMVGGFATIAGAVMAGYVMMGISASHIMIASVMSVPAGIMIGKIIYPETEQSETSGNVKLPKVDMGTNILDAAAKGTTDGLHLALNVAAMLIAFISLISFVDLILGYMDGWIDGSLFHGKLLESGEYAGYFPGSLKTIFGNIFAPLVYLMGVPAADVREVGNLFGLKIAVNEFVAYSTLAGLIKEGAISVKSEVIATYLLCGFANFASIGIQLGGLSALAPERRSDLARLGFRAMIGGAIASALTATIAGLLI